MGELILYDRTDHVAIITMNRPEALNAITVDMIEAFCAALNQASTDDEVRALVLTGTGRAFCVGADLNQLKHWADDPGLRERFNTLAPAMFRQLEQFPRPIIAALNGVTAAGGFELCCLADIVVAADEAKIGDAHANFVGFGPVSAVMAAQMLPYKLAAELLFTGEMWSARRMWRAGFVNQVVPAARVMEVAKDLAHRIAGKQPLALAAAKAFLRRSARRVDSEALRQEAFARAQEIFATADFAEGLRAFEEKRVPRFTGR